MLLVLPSLAIKRSDINCNQKQHSYSEQNTDTHHSLYSILYFILMIRHCIWFFLLLLYIKHSDIKNGKSFHIQHEVDSYSLETSKYNHNLCVNPLCYVHIISPHLLSNLSTGLKVLKWFVLNFKNSVFFCTSYFTIYIYFI